MCECMHVRECVLKATINGRCVGSNKSSSRGRSRGAATAAVEEAKAFCIYCICM